MKEKILKYIRDYWNEKTAQKAFIKGKTPVPVSGAVIDDDDVSHVADALLDGWFTEWTYASKFQRNLAKYVGVKHAILCNSGSSASLLATLACIEKFCKNKKQYKIATCATAFPTTVAPITQFGYVPLFIDTDPQTLNVDAKEVIKCLEQPDVAGVVLAHTLGFPIEGILSIRHICDKEGKFLVEDACDALGGEYDNFQPLGSFGHCSTLSFFPAHQITTGEGGAVLTDEDDLAEIVRCYSEWGRACICKPGQTNTCGKRFEKVWRNMPPGYDDKYTFIRFGYNMKMTELQAALGFSQLQKADAFRETRQKHYTYLYASLYSLREREKLQFVAPDSHASPFGFPITVTDPKLNKNELVKFLEERKIATRPVFAGNITRQPMFDNVYYENHSKLTGSDYVMENTFWIGVHPGLTMEMLDWQIECVYEYVKGK